MKLDLERGKHISVQFDIVDFVLNNSDILSSLAKTPLHIRRTGENIFTGKIFGANVKVEKIESTNNGNQGRLRTLSDIRLPLGLGHTYAKTSNTYFEVSQNITSIDFKLQIEITGLMRLYALIIKRNIDSYIDNMCNHIELASQMIAQGRDRDNDRLDQEQKARIDHFRDTLQRKTHHSSYKGESLDATVNISMVKNTTLVHAEAVMPDKRFVAAKSELSHDNKKHQSIQHWAVRLARINNPAFVVRGELEHETINMEFRQAAFEFGRHLFNDYFGGKLSSVMPVLSLHGSQTFLHFAVDERLEGLPWEALHDGKDFLATKVRFARSIGVSKQRTENTKEGIDNFGILLIGSDSRGDLPGTAVEVETIGNLLTKAGIGRIEVLTGPKAARQHVIDSINSGKFNVMHFSGHSVFNSEYPYQSFLELAHGTKLFLHEMDYLNRAQPGRNPLKLVFLNSCQSGRSGLDHTSGRSLSLCRILREAGVENVIGMLWNVADEAAVQVASTFYEYIAVGKYMDTSEALRQTRCKIAIERAWQDGSWLAPVLYV